MKLSYQKICMLLIALSLTAVALSSCGKETGNATGSKFVVTGAGN